MDNKYILSRSTYKTVKRMDHDAMERFLCDIYCSGIEQAEKDSLTLDEIRTALSDIKGIGDKRLAEIMEVLSKLIQ